VKDLYRSDWLRLAGRAQADRPASRGRRLGGAPAPLPVPLGAGARSNYAVAGQLSDSESAAAACVRLSHGDPARRGWGWPLPACGRQWTDHPSLRLQVS
jgi:hypothetical protein